MKLLLAITFSLLGKLAAATSEPYVPVASDLEEAVRDFLVDMGGLEDFERIVEQEPFDRNFLDSEDLVHEMAAELSHKFENTARAVENLRNSVEKAYAYDKWEVVTECCQLQPFNYTWHPLYDHRFRTEVDFYRSCSRITGDKMSTFRMVDSQNRSPATIASIAMENLQMAPGMKYQYYGDENGIFTQYPAVRTDSDCESYDNRFRPWYVVAATPDPKDVVVVIDISGSMMLDDRMSGAKAAVITVLETLNPNDRVAVVAFASYIKLPEDGSISCYSKELALATPLNTKFIRDWISRIDPYGGTHFVPALNKAFDYFDYGQDNPKAEEDKPRKKVMLFMSDGKPSDTEEDILKTIHVRNHHLNYSVVIMTYAFGDGASGNILYRMSRQEDARGLQTPDYVPIGTYVTIHESKNLRTKMGSYYDHFKSTSIDTSVQWGVPYYDAIGGSGLVITASAAVVVGGHLKGVVGADITMRELLTEVTYFKINHDKAYSFLVDRHFRALAHPFLSAPSSVDSDPVFVNISMLERSKLLYNALLPEIMSMQNSDGIVDMTTFTIPTMWVTEMEHGMVDATHELATFSCKEVGGSTPFAACVVVRIGGEAEYKVYYQGHPEDFTFHYHRLDLHPPEDQCIHLNRPSFVGSSVKLSPRCFDKMESYLELEETYENVSSYKYYIEHDIYNHEGLSITEEAKNDVRFTFSLENIWRESQYSRSSLGMMPLWRYIGTRTGVFRIWPGVQLSQEYDPTMRPWYKAAMAHQDILVITTPYQDASSGLWVVTFAKTILYPYGAIGTDVVLANFKTILRGSEEECQTHECTLVDLSGHVIYHKEYDSANPDTVGSHLVDRDPDTSKQLLDKGVLVPHKCIDVSLLKIRHSLRIDLNKLEQLELLGFEFDGFHLKHIVGTNAVLIVEHHDREFHQFFECIRHSSTEEECESFMNHPCQSPCQTKAEFENCINQHDYEWEIDPPPCAAATPKLTILPQNDLTDTDSDLCYSAFESLEIYAADDPWGGINVWAPWEPPTWEPTDEDESRFPVSKILQYTGGAILGVSVIVYFATYRSHRRNRGRNSNQVGTNAVGPPQGQQVPTVGPQHNPPPGVVQTHPPQAMGQNFVPQYSSPPPPSPQVMGQNFASHYSSPPPPSQPIGNSNAPPPGYDVAGFYQTGIIPPPPTYTPPSVSPQSGIAPGPPRNTIYGNQYP